MQRPALFCLVVCLIESVVWAQIRDEIEMRVVVDETEIYGPPEDVVRRTVNGRILLTTRVEGIHGWAFGIRVADLDPGVTMSFSHVKLGADILTVNNGGPPDFVATTLYPPDDSPDSTDVVAVAHSIVIDLQLPVTLPVSTDFEMMRFRVNIEGNVSPAELPPLCGSIIFADDVGGPPVPTVVTFSGASFVPGVLESAEICLTPGEDDCGDGIDNNNDGSMDCDDPTCANRPPCTLPFHRGDVNDDGLLDISDPIALLGYLFLAAPAPGCMDAADTNDDGMLDISDATELLNFQFSGGAPPAPPGSPGDPCGIDPALHAPGGCAEYNSC